MVNIDQYLSLSLLYTVMGVAVFVIIMIVVIVALLLTVMYRRKLRRSKAPNEDM